MNLTKDLAEKERRLARYLKELPPSALAFSGGVDSAYLFYSAVSNGADIHAIYASSPFQPAFELLDAQRLADELGAPLTVLELDIFTCRQAVENGPRRCYFCKRAIFTALRDKARALGCSLLLDGSNASDDAADRPGMQACRELGVISPLRECGLTKGDIRALSRESALFTWDKPSYSCLATRVATGQRLTKELLSRIEAGEGVLFELGFSDFRLRVRGDKALLQVTAEQMEQARARFHHIRQALAPYFPECTLDDQPRKASL